ncbi:S-layer homology domain-containing protein [Bacillus sp. 3255]|uniref:S-layer homology domain-containing protein n=1 Tax=Bacillus sp. 3255 TaxID=2817904 RepID=UPI0028598830|nr:S-layer homology domain-containing protein [Bacillus sp. 3255]MDR6880816.1 hypothetical protein [Bacillus sp. 3255]
MVNRTEADPEIPVWAGSAVASISKLGILQGRNLNRFEPQAQATRAEAIILMLNILDHKQAKP